MFLADLRLGRRLREVGGARRLCGDAQPAACSRGAEVLQRLTAHQSHFTSKNQSFRLKAIPPGEFEPRVSTREQCVDEI